MGLLVIGISGRRERHWMPIIDWPKGPPSEWGIYELSSTDSTRNGTILQFEGETFYLSLPRIPKKRVALFARTQGPISLEGVHGDQRAQSRSS